MKCKCFIHSFQSLNTIFKILDLRIICVERMYFRVYNTKYISFNYTYLGSGLESIHNFLNFCVFI